MIKRTDSTQFWIVRFLFTFLLLGQVFLYVIKAQVCLKKTLENMYKVGPESLFPISLVTSFVGMIFTINLGRELVKYNAVNTIGEPFALAFWRLLAPTLVAIFIAGKIGSAFAAEIGMMKVTEQIDALHMLKTCPINYLIVPKVVACSLMLPILTFVSLVTGTSGGICASSFMYQVSPDIFLESIRNVITTTDLLVVLLKAFIFGVIISLISCSWGLTCFRGAKEVGESTTQAIVTSSVCIFVVDLLISMMLFDKPIYFTN